ncbi:hypothetical protein ES703_83548 [subsurface metagenome]
MAEKQRISPAVVIPIGLGLGLAAALGIAAVAAAARIGKYTQVEIVVPDSASAGEMVPVTIKVTNTWSYQFAVYGEALYNSEWGFDTEDRWIYPGETLSFSGSFTMPDRDITIHAYSYVLDGELGLPEGWHRDAEGKKSVALI